MHHMYSDESEAVKAKIDKKYEEMKARYTKQCQCLKSGKPPKIDKMAKIKAINELGPMLDQVLKYLGHMTGGWKFSVLMGGHDPSTGEVSVFNYHVGEVESGAHFDQAYNKFDAVQSTFLEFVKKSIAFKSTLTQEPESAKDEEEDESDGLLLLDSDSDEEWGKSGGEGVQSQVQEDLGNHLYHMTPQSDGGVDLPPNANDASSTSLVYTSPTGYATTTSDASFSFDSQAAAAHHITMDFSVLDPSLSDPIVLGNLDFSVFDPAAFSAAINDPTFDINALNSSDVPPMNSYPEVQDHLCLSTSIPQTPEVLLPAVHHEEGEENDDSNESPAASHARCRNHFDRTQAPALSTEQPQAPCRRARNNIPFNPCERDNEIGASTHCAPTSVAAKHKRKNAEENSEGHNIVKIRKVEMLESEEPKAPGDE
ncbi:uncharacterized protein F5147DRAFT_773604 [Suillus discolor]|uniref:Uncharacterized protein n=1 Tax=Suillus discolor TaxID=1912936 RepID=A0A9P7JU52_9AGAM|nr:uncharacterized protein F5147DRAFT_773604 [Suillus discolor]KAG2108397.1 hypothetical protein F5147DRAFT_773604 [Suillus discolor]